MARERSSAWEEYGKAWAARRRQKLREVPAGEPLPGGLRHGTHSAYVAGCLCKECKAASDAYKAQQKLRLLESLVSDEPLPGNLEHGMYATYILGCRCDACTQANADYHRRREQKARRTKIPKPLKKDTHGEHACFTAGCRCDLCTEAMSTRYKEWYRRSCEKKGATAPKVLKRDTHGEPACYNAGCRCDLCTAAASQRSREWMKRHPGVSAVYSAKNRRHRLEYGLHLGVPIKHGELDAYINLGCRCELCKEANTKHVTESKERRVAKGGPIPHGVSGYGNYKCRCDICKAAKAEYVRGYWARKKVERAREVTSPRDPADSRP